MAAETIVVLTYNLFNHHEGEGDFARRASAITRLVRQLAPDVLCLQEVPSPDIALALAATLSETKQWHMRVACTEMLRPDGWREHLAIVHPGTRRTATRVAAPTGEHIAIAVQLAEPAITVLSVHLNPQSADVRHAQAEALLASLPKSGPVVLAGDLNAAPGGGTLSLLRQELEPLAPGEDVRTTFPTGLREALAEGGGAVLDHILGRGLRVEGEGVVGAEQVEGIWASDHVGVWAKLATSDKQ